jgi:hypothetical protein
MHRDISRGKSDIDILVANAEVIVFENRVEIAERNAIRDMKQRHSANISMRCRKTNSSSNWD